MDETVKKEAIIKLLDKHNIPLDKWGEGVAKTLDHLIAEIDSGESVLIENEEGELIRLTNVVGVEITYIDESGRAYKLIEDRQIFKDGRERKRNLDVSVAEKIQADEEPERAARRAIQEELGILGEIKLSFNKKENMERYSNSYPGIKTFYRKHYYRAGVSNEQYSPDGYIEEQADKTSYFVWVQAEAD